MRLNAIVINKVRQLLCKDFNLGHTIANCNVLCFSYQIPPPIYFSHEQALISSKNIYYLLASQYNYNYKLLVQKGASVRLKTNFILMQKEIIAISLQSKSKRIENK